MNKIRRVIKKGRIIVARQIPGVEHFEYLQNSDGKIWTFKTKKKAEEFLVASHISSEDYQFLAAKQDIIYFYGKKLNERTN